MTYNICGCMCSKCYNYESGRNRTTPNAHCRILKNKCRKAYPSQITRRYLRNYSQQTDLDITNIINN